MDRKQRRRARRIKQIILNKGNEFGDNERGFALWFLGPEAQGLLRHLPQLNKIISRKARKFLQNE